MSKQFPPQHQDKQPGNQKEMIPRPITVDEHYRAAGKLKGKTAIITGGDSGIGQAVSIAFAKEGANVVIVYLNETEDAQTAKSAVEREGSQCLLLAGDIGRSEFCNEIIEKTLQSFGQLDIVVNNAAEQHVQQTLGDITEQQLHKTFQTNLYSMFYLTQTAIPHLKSGSTIINTTSVTGYRGSPTLIDYSATKGAITSFTRSLALNLANKNIRVNGVAPGPIWTPLIPASFDKDKVAQFGADTPMGRAGQPYELAPAYVYLACSDSSFMTGQILHINGGEIING